MQNMKKVMQKNKARHLNWGVPGGWCLCGDLKEVRVWAARMCWGSGSGLRWEPARCVWGPAAVQCGWSDEHHGRRWEQIRVGNRCRSGRISLATVGFFWLRWEATGRFWVTLSILYILRGLSWLLCWKYTARGQRWDLCGQQGGHCTHLREKWQKPGAGMSSEGEVVK